MTRLILIAAFSLVLATGCGPGYGGGSCGSYADADKETSTAVATQRDPNGRLLFVVAWTAKQGSGSAAYSRRNLLTKIHDRPVHPSLERRTVYALKLDGSLQAIPLSDEHVAMLFREMQQSDFHTSHSELWQKMIAPHLIRVEARNGR